MRFIAVAVVALAILAGAVSAQSDLEISTQYGPVQGFYHQYGPHTVRAWWGIPYAAPPVGNLRWQPTAPPQAWNQPLNTSAFAPGCPQNCTLPPITCPARISEDCLYLNVYAPLTPPATPLPVLFWIHGGHFEFGSGEGPIYESAITVNNSDVVVVTINYRLGALGWLYISDELSNFGLMDQLTALHWVQNNIKSFGGDPNQVTIYGQSAGGTSVSTLMASPAVQAIKPKLFHQAIVHSNPFGIPVVNPISGSALAARFAKDVQCSSDPIDMACLRARTVEEVLTAQPTAAKHLNLSDFLQVGYPWAPAIGSWLPDHPLYLFAKGQVPNIPLMMGTVSEEGRLFIFAAEDKPVGVLDYIALVTLLFKGKFLKVLEQYPPHKGDDHREQLSNILSDYAFTCPLRYAARGVLNSGLTPYLWRFNHSFSFSGGWAKDTFCEGHVCHSEELPFVFNDAYMQDYQFDADEKVLSDTMSAAWGNFAKTGAPNVQGWTPYTEASDNYIEWLSPNGITAFGVRKTQCDFFDSIGYDLNKW